MGIDHDYLHIRESLWQNSTPIHDKNTQDIEILSILMGTLIGILSYKYTLVLKSEFYLMEKH